MIRITSIKNKILALKRMMKRMEIMGETGQSCSLNSSSLNNLILTMKVCKFNSNGI
jgi:hypothetical protein